MNKEEEEAPVQPHFSDDDEDNEEDDESGEDLMKTSGNVVGSDGDDDSSEESEDDPEEAKRIADGFIVDEDEEDGGSDEESRRRRRKARKRRKRLAAEEENDEALDEDDLDLLAENTGIRRKQRQLKRFRRASASPPTAGEDAAAAAREPRDLQHMFDDDDDDAPVASRRSGRRGDDDEDDEDDDDLPSVGDALRANANQRGQTVAFNYEDEMEDFIDDDDESEMDEAMSEGEREQRREERRQQRKAELEERRKRRNGLGFDPSRAGIDAEAWAELNEVFGDGNEYEEFLKLDDESDGDGADAEQIEARRQRKEAKVKTMAQIFEPSAMQARMMTSDDERIKSEDFPERFQMMLPGDEGTSLLARILSSAELDECARWVSTRFSYRSHKFLSDAGEYSMYRDAWFKCVRTMCEHIINERREAMYLCVNRVDDFQLRVGTSAEPIYLLQRRDFFSLVASCLKFKTLLARRDSLRETFERVLEDGVDVSPELRATFEQLLQRTESTDEVTEVSDWLIMHLGQRMRDAQAHRDSSFKRPTVLSQYEQLKGTTVATLATRFGITATQLAENVCAQSRAHFTEDDETAPLTAADEYAGDGTTASSGPPTASLAIESARKLLAHEIGRDPTIKREARRLLRESGLISVKPTDQGHYKIDDEHPYYNFKFLDRKPVTEFTSTTVTEKLPSQAQYLLMLRAEEELLVEVSVSVREMDARAFEQRLSENYLSEGFSETSRLWNVERRQIIRQALEELLYPAAKLWVREWLREECWEFIGRLCEVALTNRIERRPYESTTMRAVKELRARRLAQPYGRDFDEEDEHDQLAEGRENVPKVLAISHGRGDNRRDEIETVFLDIAGRMREHIAFETIEKPASDPNEMLLDGEQDQANKRPDPSREFIALLRERRPDVIVIGGFSPRTVALRQQVQKLTQELVEEVKIEMGDDVTEAQLNAVTIDVIHCQDDVARLYQHSSRAKEEFASLSILARYCVGLARYVQSPVQEFAALSDDDLRALRFDGHQALIPPERLLQSLERALVAIVNTVCVDLNRCIIDAYYANMLQYVAGLGRRKTEALKSAINDQLDGHIVNRDALLLGAQGSARNRQSEREDFQPILGPHVWMNACSFLIIRTADLNQKSARRQRERAEAQGGVDALDCTRIHPEIYDKARFIAGDALQKTEEDQVADQHDSAWVAELLRDEDRRAKVENIDMEDYERQLMAEAAKEGLARQRWLFRLEFVARELAEPLLEQRLPFALPSGDEIVTMLTGETRATFDTQHLVTVTVRQTTRDYAIVQLESGIEGTIHQEYLLPKDSAEYPSKREVPFVRDLVKHGQTLKALIIDVDLDNVRVELTARPSHVEAAKAADAQRRRVEVDARYFDREQADLERDEAERTRQRKQNANRGARSIRHPDFHNFKAGQAEEYLANGPRGSAVVRPSSKGDNHLAVTWKVDDGVYQHFDVLELDKDPRQEIGRILRVANLGGSSYSDIDELLVNHVAPMARMVEMLMAHEKYHGSEEELQRYLTTFSLANPHRSQYGFAIDRKRPGLFVLGFKANRDAQILRWVVRILPGRFKLNEAELPDVVSLCNAFKTQYTTRSMRSGGAGVSAVVGGRTPAAGLAGGTTPGVMRSGLGGGVTPRVGGYGGGGASVRAVRPIGGATPYGATPMVGMSYAGGGISAPTPNPYAYGGSGARPPPPGAPPIRPGPPPARPPQLGGYGAGGPPPPPPGGQASTGIHPDRLAQMGAGGALPGSNGHRDPRDYNNGW